MNTIILQAIRLLVLYVGIGLTFGQVNATTLVINFGSSGPVSIDVSDVPDDNLIHQVAIDDGGGTGQILITAAVGSEVGSAILKKLYLNFDSAFDLSLITFEDATYHPAQELGDTVTVGQNLINSAYMGLYDILLDFGAESGGISAGEHAAYFLESPEPIVSSSFRHLSADGGASHIGTLLAFAEWEIDGNTTFTCAAVLVEFGDIVSCESIVIPNEAPTADAGNDVSLLELGLVQLDGTQSMDSDGDAFTFAWMLEPPSGSSAMLDDATSSTPGFTADLYGNYVATLVVTDSNNAASDPDSVTVGFDNLPPVADAGSNQAVLVGDTVVLDGSNSSDANMDALTYLWNFDTMPVGSMSALMNATTDSPGFVVDQVGDYIIQLVTNDGLLNSLPATVLVTAIAVADAADETAMDLVVDINELATDDFQNRNMQNALTNKLNVILKMMDRGNYQNALDKLTSDVLTKTDGCAATGVPDSNDWIIDCDEQANAMQVISELSDLLQRLIDG